VQAAVATAVTLFCLLVPLLRTVSPQAEQWSQVVKTVPHLVVLEVL
jgi:hypothetical protein